MSHRTDVPIAGSNAARRADVRGRIRRSIAEYFRLDREAESFSPGRSLVQYAGACFDEEEIIAMVDTLLDGWFGLGKNGLRFEREFPPLLGKTEGILVNSGSSANLVAVSALASKSSPDRLRPGDEVITCATGFPTTVNPLFLHGLVPVFVDVQLGTYNIDVTQLERALSPRTRAVVFAHTLGNPADMRAVTDFASRHGLVVIEDCCDAVGSSLGGRPLGSFGRLSTVSFYPAHHMTMGEGGFVAAGSGDDLRILRSLRDWGRDCHCVGKGNLLRNGTCGRRFSRWLDGVDEIVDHKYVYSEIGYNLKPLECQAAMALVQMRRLPSFRRRRAENFDRLRRFFKHHEDLFILPESLPEADPCWFAFPLTVRPSAPFSRGDIVARLEDSKVQTRSLFAGNLLRHPAYRGVPHRVIGDLRNADTVLTSTFLLGVYPGITDEIMDHVLSCCEGFLAGQSSRPRARGRS